MNSYILSSLYGGQKKTGSQFLNLVFAGIFLCIFCTVCARTIAVEVDSYETGSGVGTGRRHEDEHEDEKESTLGNAPLRSMNKRSFFDIQCKGVYDKGIFAKLDRVCDDCYNLYREPQLHALCSQKCFSTSYFIGCLDALTLSDNEKEYQQLILSINADNPFDDPIDSKEKPEPEPKPKSKSKLH